ncbi:MAG TPA: GNAT family N-acetyltransferase, partial [Pirellulales bacterium]
PSAGEPAIPRNRHFRNAATGESMTFPERIETERLLLRWPTDADAEQIFVRYASDPVVTKYLTWAPHKTVDDTLTFLKWRRESRGQFTWIVTPRAGGPLLGGIGCRRDQHIVQFGYCFAREAWGRGYATEAAREMVNCWLSEPTVWRVQAFCNPINLASARVLEKCGLSLEGTLRRHALTPNFSNEPCDALCYAIVRESQ